MMLRTSRSSRRIASYSSMRRVTSTHSSRSFSTSRPGELLQAHGQDGVGLDAREVEGVLRGRQEQPVGLVGLLAGEVGDAEGPGLLHQPLLGGGHVRALLDRLDDLVDVGHRVEEAEEDVLAGLGLLQQEQRPPPDDLDAVVLVGHQQFLQVHRPRAALVEGDVDDREGVLQRRVVVELVQDDGRVGVALEFDDQAHALAVGFVADVGDALDDAVLDALGDPLDDAGLDLAVRDLGDDDAAPCRRGLPRCGPGRGR